MIRFLSIRHLAVVDALELEFEPGFTVLTGETGAGKSIVLSALGLLIGDRASSDLVRTGEDKAAVQAAVEIEGREVILRREITAHGRSRAFIDDALATAGAMQGLGRQFVDLHGQHQHQALLDPRNHLALLDAYGDSRALTSDVAVGFGTWRTARGRLEQARLGDREKTERVDLLTFQLGEIDRVNPSQGEDDRLLATRQRLANADRLKTLCGDAYGALYERDHAVVASLGRVWRQVEELASLDPAFEPHLENRDGVQAQIEELAFALRSYTAQIEASPERLAEVESRLADVERLKKKYGPRLADVRDRRDAMAAELEALTSGATTVGVLEQAEQSAREQFLLVARRLSRRRQKEARALAGSLQKVLRELAMPRAEFEVRFEPGELSDQRWSESGLDALEFFFTANPGEARRPLAKVVSGGELSRVMLGLKTLASTDLTGKTLVFDEVDAGIGGSVADQVGSRLRALGERFQIVCVTHLPQIAAYATTHYHVSKVVRDGRTVTRVERLAEQGRVAELARLMTGGASSQARASAKELLLSKQNTKGESERAKAKG